MQLGSAMSETNTRREARRRRILENSESRLRKITSRNNPDELEDDDSLKNNSVRAKPSLEKYTEFNDVCGSECDAKNNICNTKNGICNIDEEKLQDYVGSNIDEHEIFLNNNERDIYSSERISKVEHGFMLCTLLANRMNFILLAGIVNILIVLKLDDWFGQAIVIPYMLLMLGRLYNYKKLYELQDGSLLVAALILCNIKPNLVCKFKILLTLFNVILSDFSLYMFSFILIRYVITYYHNYNVLTST